MIRYKDDATDDRQALIALKTGIAGVPDSVFTENNRLREALSKIYSEAMMANEPPASTWYRIAEIADLALACEEAK